jgi:hypothetical protein
MPASGRSLLSLPRLVAMALAAVVICAVVPGAASALGLAIGDPAAGPSTAVSLADKDFAAGERRDQARSERLASANARTQRTNSRTAHGDLGRDAALALARQMFPEQMTGRLFDGAEPAAGLRVVDQRGEGTALVQDTQTGKRALLMSTLPLQAKRPDGTLEPIDLSLQSTSSGVGPTNSLAPFRVDPVSAASVSFPAKGVSVSVRGGERHTVQTASDRAFFANVLQDTDVSIMPMPDGAELSVIVRSSQAPERFVLDVTLPAGARLRRAVARDPIPGDPPQSLEIVRGEQTLGYIHPPVAIDADGQPVAATMALDGQDIVLEVSHRDRDIHYPVNIDPEMRLYSDYYADWLRWSWTQNRSGGGSFGAAKNDCAYYCGLYQSVPTNTTLTNGSVAQWYYPAPVNTYLYRTTFGGIAHNPLYAYGYNHTRSYMGLLNGAGTAWETNVNYVNQAGITGPNPYGPNSGAYYGLQHDFCFNPRCDPKPAAATEQNNAIFGLQAQNAFGGTTLSSGPYKGTTTMAWANVYLGDRRPPSLTTATPASRDWTDEPAGTTHTITPGVHDDGLGIYGMGLDGAASGGGFVSQGCLGDIVRSPCPADWSHSFTYTLNEGINNLNVYGQDFVDSRTPGGNWTEKIDRTAPAATLSGVLWDRRNQDDGTDLWLTAGGNPLTVAATDGDSSSAVNARSGVKTIDVYVDGTQTPPRATGPDVAMHKAQGCANGSCPMSLDWIFSTIVWGPGDHTISTTVTDQLGHASPTQSWTVTAEDPATEPTPPARDAVVYDQDVASVRTAQTATQASARTCGDGDATAGAPANAPCPTLLYYVSDSSNARYSHADSNGCNAARTINAGTHGFYYVLQFGATKGTEDVTLMSDHSAGPSNRLTFAQDLKIAESFAKGYTRCLDAAMKDGHHKLSIAMGTTNDGLTSTSLGQSNGQRWGDQVKAFAKFVAGRHTDGRTWSDWIIARGAIDMENGYSQPEAARAFVDGYSAHWSGTLVDIGAIDGCPPKGNCAAQSDRIGCSTSTAASCVNHWTQADDYYVSWGQGHVVSIPQIYVPDAKAQHQWQHLSLYGACHPAPCSRSRQIVLPAPITQRNRAGTDGQFDFKSGWSALAKALNHDRGNAYTRENRIPFNVQVAASW